MPTRRPPAKKEPHHHPICHFINGERLHYLLLKVRTQLREAGKTIRDVINDEKLGVASASCAYYIFGDSDVIVRLWATEEHLHKFQDALRSKAADVEAVTVIVVERMLTWYQQQIEIKTDWHAGLTPTAIKEIAEHKIPDVLKAPANKRKSTGANSTKFFLFIEESFARRSNIFYKLQNDLKCGMPEFLASMKKVSLYAFTTKDYPGVLIKGEIEDTKALTTHLLAFADKMKVYPVKTTTFICSDAIKDDENALNPELKIPPFNARKEDICYNLVRAHDCDKKLIVQYGGANAEKVAAAFCQIGAGLIDEIFAYHEDWWHWLGDLRLLYKWISFSDAGKVMGKLRQEYVRIERSLLEITDKAMDRFAATEFQRAVHVIARDSKQAENLVVAILEKGMKILPFEKHITLGRMPKFLDWLLKQTHATQEEKRDIEEFAKRLEKGKDDRNALMHGKITPGTS